MKILRKGYKFIRQPYGLALKLVRANLSVIIVKPEPGPRPGPGPRPEHTPDIYPWLLANKVGQVLTYLAAKKDVAIDYNVKPMIIKDTLSGSHD